MGSFFWDTLYNKDDVSFQSNSQLVQLLSLNNSDINKTNSLHSLLSYGDLQYFQSEKNVIEEVVIRMGFLSQEEHPALICTGAPFLLGVSYVASLYVS